MVSETGSLGTGNSLVEADILPEEESESINSEALNKEIHHLTTDLQSGTEIYPADIINIVTLKMDESSSRDEKIEQLRRNFDNFFELSDRESFKCDVCLILNQVSKAVKGWKIWTDCISDTFHKTEQVSVPKIKLKEARDTCIFYSQSVIERNIFFSCVGRLCEESSSDISFSKHYTILISSLKRWFDGQMTIENRVDEINKHFAK